MFLRCLVEYSYRIGLPPRLYNEASVRYLVDLNLNADLLNPSLIDTANPSVPRERRGVRRLVPQVQRAAGVKPLLLADKADYVLGFAAPDANATRVAQCNQAFLALLSRCAERTGEPSVVAVESFLRNAPLGKLQLPADFDPGATISFRVDGLSFPVDLPSVQAFWAEENDPAAKSAPLMQCLICGQRRPVLDRLQAKVKGVPGGQTSGTSIISANAEAFESYGLKASHIAPTCADCGERFTKALNHLLSSERNCLRTSSAAFVFWTRELRDFDFYGLISDPQPDSVKALLSSVSTGIKPVPLDETKFYAASLSGSGGRAVVRDWIDTTIDNAQESIGRWFQRQQIVNAYGEMTRYFGLHALAGATVRELRDVPTPTYRVLFRGAVQGTPLPEALLYQAVRRNRAEQTVTHSRAALIKLVLLSQRPDVQEDFMVELDTDNTNAAYRCGRLLAVLEQVQRLAIPGAKATIVDRFFGTASSVPASVFGRLLRGAQPHLGKLQRDRPGAYFALQRRLEDILSGLPARGPTGDTRGFPRTLALGDQALFALGYYHQRAHDRQQAAAAKARREAGGADEPDADLESDQDTAN